MSDNYLAVADALTLSQEELIQCAKNGFSAAFLSESEITQHHQAIDEYVVSFNG